MSDILFCVAPNGARMSKADHPALPVTPKELADCAEECVQAGAAMIHLHVRDDQQKHILDADRYIDATRAIRQRLGDDIVIQVTTEAVGQYKADEQRFLVQNLKPEAVSLGLRELLPEGGDEKTFADFWQWMRKERIWPQIILYNDNDIQRLIDMRTRGIFDADHLSVLVVLGRYGKGFGEPRNLISPYFLLENQKDMDWSVCAFGPQENACIATAATLGGHARIGFENNHIMADTTVAKNNAALISQAVDTCKLLGRTPINAQQLRSLRITR